MKNTNQDYSGKNQKDNKKQNIDFEKQFLKAKKELDEKITKPNIVLLGRTGCGKSTIINDIFGENTVETGVGKPITKGFSKISDPNIDVTIYDSEGYEIDESDGDDFINKAIDFINAKSLDDKDRIHIVWLVISSNSNRVTDYEIQLYAEIKKTNTPVAVLFSKCDETNEDDINPMIKRFYPNTDFDKSKNNTEPPFFIISNKIESRIDNDIFSKKNLIKWSIDKLPEICKLAFISSQKVSLDIKKDLSNKIIIQHTTGNAITGFTPIPFSDAPILAGSQIAMLVRIFKVYGVSGHIVVNFSKSIALGTTVSTLGKSLVGQLLKFIPVVGTTAGGAINASVASAITFAMGKASSEILYTFYNKIINNELQIDEDILSYVSKHFNEYLKRFYNQKSDNKI